jgi:DNA-binding transcriptional LysR family regulator
MALDRRLLNGVSVLAAVVETGNFARAGKAQGLTPSAISRAVARLEARIGIRLFDRNPRAVVLTDEGRRFHAQVAPLLTGIEEAAEEAAGASATVRGRLKLNLDPWFARIVLAPRLPELTARYPQLSLELLVSNHREDMMAGGVDLAVRFGPPDPSALIARKILETRIITCASPGYLARRGTPKVPQDIPNHEALLFRDPQSGRPFGWEFHRRKNVVEIPVDGSVVMDDPSAALAACEAGLGLFQSFELGLAPWLASGKLVQVLPEWSDERFPLYAYYPSRRQAPAKLRAFLEFIQLIAANA